MFASPLFRYFRELNINAKLNAVNNLNSIIQTDTGENINFLGGGNNDRVRDFSAPPAELPVPALMLLLLLLLLQLQAAEASLTERSTREAARQNDLQQRCTKYEHVVAQYRAQRVSSSTQSLYSMLECAVHFCAEGQGGRYPQDFGWTLGRSALCIL